MQWPQTLRSFQVDGVSALAASDALLLADEMGLGKTIQCIAALRILAGKGHLRQALIIVPAGLLMQWRRELHTWAPDLRAMRVHGTTTERAWKWKAERQIFLVSYDTLRSDVSAVMTRTWDVVVLDEAQKIKNRGTTVSKLCKRLPRLRSWALTGTPLENSVDELASVLEFVRSNPAGARMPPISAGFRMRAIQQDVQLRRRKADVLPELPPKDSFRVTLELSARQRAAYEELEDAGRAYLHSLGRSATIINVLELITRLKQICNFCPFSGESAKLTDVQQRMDELRANRHRALLFSQWRNEVHGVRRIANELQRFDPLVYCGDQLLDERAAIVERFRTEPRHSLLALSLRAGGHGLNLQEASYVFHFDRWWNPAIENQATDRAHRLGQKRAVTVYAYVCTDTIEERIERILDNKRQLFSDLVDLVSLDVRRLMTDDEIFGLFGMEAPVRRRRAVYGGIEARVTRLLRRGRWVVTPVAGGLTARIHDELGVARDARLHVINDRLATEDDIATLACTSGMTRCFVVAEKGFTSAAMALASERRIALWTLEDLEKLEEGTPPA